MKQPAVPELRFLSSMNSLRRKARLLSSESDDFILCQSARTSNKTQWIITITRHASSIKEIRKKTQTSKWRRMTLKIKANSSVGTYSDDLQRVNEEKFTRNTCEDLQIGECSREMSSRAWILFFALRIKEDYLWIHHSLFSANFLCRRKYFWSD